MVFHFMAANSKRFNLFDESVLELHEHLTKEHTIDDDNRVQDMRRICIELLESRNLQTGDRDFLVCSNEFSAR